MFNTTTLPIQNPQLINQSAGSSMLKATIMDRKSDLKTLTNSIKCLIVFENKISSLYKDLAEKTTHLPLVKSLLTQVSLDSQKHSTILKGVVQSLPKTNWKPNELPKAITEAWRSMDSFQIELSDVEEIAEEDISNLSKQLSNLESIMGEAYDIIVQYQTLELLSMALCKLYNAEIESIKTIFMEIIHDESYHKEILTLIKELLDKEDEKEKTTETNTPTVRFQNPDAWIRPTSPTV
jgi:hypothetical protein